VPARARRLDRHVDIALLRYADEGEGPVGEGEHAVGYRPALVEEKGGLCAAGGERLADPTRAAGAPDLLVAAEGEVDRTRRREALADEALGRVEGGD